MDCPIYIVANSQISYNSMGGSDKIFIETARVWKKLGYFIIIFCCREARKLCERSGLEGSFKIISKFDVERLGLLIAYSLRTISSVFRFKIIEEGILYSSSDFFPDLIFAFWQKLFNKRIIWVAGIFLIAQNPFKIKESRNLRGFLYWIMQRAGINLMRLRADLIVVLCEKDKNFLIKKGISKEKIIIISGGVDIGTIKSIPEQTKIYDACFVGRFHQQKGVPELIKIWRKVVDNIPQANLAIIGWGDNYWVNLIKGLVTSNGLRDNISMLGFLDNEEKYKVLKASRIFAFPSSYESWGIVIAEAFACGCPVVAFDISATRKFNKGIMLVKLGDIDSYAQKIIELLNDKELYSRYSLSAKEEAGHLSWDNTAKNILEKIEGLYV